MHIIVFNVYKVLLNNMEVFSIGPYRFSKFRVYENPFIRHFRPY